MKFLIQQFLTILALYSVVINVGAMPIQKEDLNSNTKKSFIDSKQNLKPRGMNSPYSDEGAEKRAFIVGSNPDPKPAGSIAEHDYGRNRHHHGEKRAFIVGSNPDPKPAGSIPEHDYGRNRHHHDE